MCGLFGFVSTNGQGPSLSTLRDIAINTETRGHHSFGFAWIDGSNRMRCYKQTGAISNNLSRLRMLSDARMIVGHCRWATRGQVTYQNAHPFPCDGGWVMHNGTIDDSCGIQSHFDVMPQTDCDSETIALLIEQLPGTLTSRVIETIAHCATSNFAMLGLWKSPARLVIGKAGKHLNITRTRRGYYFASLPDALPGSPKPIRNETVTIFSFHGGETLVRSQPIDATDQPLFS